MRKGLASKRILLHADCILRCQPLQDGSSFPKECKLTPAALLPFPPGCRAARFLRREKRFFVIAELDGKIITAHTNNTGSMLGMLRPGAPVLLSPATTPGRKLAWTVEAIGQPGGTPGAFFWAGVNTSVPNRFLEAAFRAHLLPWTEGYDGLKREAACGESRLDGLFTSSDASLPPLWVECKNVTLVEDCVAAFPDAITARGAKHLATLARLVREGCRAAMLYLVQRPDGQGFGPADYIDPAYAAAFYDAVAEGVEIHAVTAKVTEEGIFYDGLLPAVKRTA